MCSVMWAMPGCAPSKREPARTTRAIAVSDPGTGSWRTVRAPCLRRLGSRGLGAVLRPLPAEEVLARSDPVLRLAGLPPDPLRDRRVPRAHVGQPAPARRRSPAAPPPVRRAPPITRVVLAVAALTALIVLG